MNQYQPPFQRPYAYPSPPDRYEQLRHKKPLRRWATIIGLGLLLNIAISVILGGVWARVSMGLTFYGFGGELLSLLDESAFLFIYLAALWPVTLLIMAWIKIPPEVAFPLKKPRLGITVPAVFVCLGASMVGFLVTSMISLGLETVFGVYPAIPDQPLPTGIPANVVSVIAVTLAPAIFEELLFRGVILQSLRRFGDGFAIVVSAILFGLLHANLSQSVSAAIIGLLLAYFTVRTGSLLPAMLTHFVNNGLSLLFTYLAEYLGNRQIEIMNMGMFASYLLLGIAGILFLAVRFGGLFRVAPSAYPLTTPQKAAAFFLSPAEIIFTVIILVFFVSFLAPV